MSVLITRIDVGLPLFIAHQRPAALDDDFSAIATRLMNLTLPLAVLNHSLPRLIKLR